MLIYLFIFYIRNDIFICLFIFIDLRGLGQAGTIWGVIITGSLPKLPRPINTPFFCQKKIGRT